MSECLPWQRARREDQIEQREAAILRAASELFDQHRFDEITLAMIAKQASFTRSNVYRYFKTREDVFLALMAADVDDWQRRVLTELEKGGFSVQNFVARWLPLMFSNKRLLRFYELLASVIELNASDDALRQFKLDLNANMMNVVAQLVEQSLFANPDNAQKFIISHLALVSGLYPKMNMPEKHQALMAELHMATPPDYYQTLVEEGVEALYQRYRR